MSVAEGFMRDSSCGAIPMKARRGFTLVETIVTVGLIAVLAAFVVPTVVQKAAVGDPVKVVNDLTAIRTALEGYANDTKVLPNSIWQLTAKPSVLNHQIDSVGASTGTTLTAVQAILWNGPYLSTSIDSLPAGTLETGFGSQIVNQLERYDAVANKGELFGGSTNAAFNQLSTIYLAV